MISKQPAYTSRFAQTQMTFDNYRMNTALLSVYYTEMVYASVSESQTCNLICLINNLGLSFMFHFPSIEMRRVVLSKRIVIVLCCRWLVFTFHGSIALELCWNIRVCHLLDNELRAPKSTNQKVISLGWSDWAKRQAWNDEHARWNNYNNSYTNANTEFIWFDSAYWLDCNSDDININWMR